MYKNSVLVGFDPVKDMRRPLAVILNEAFISPMDHIKVMFELGDVHVRRLDERTIAEA